MLSIKFIRENPEIVKKNIEKKFQNEKIPWVDDLLEKDKEWREIKKEIDELKHRRNSLSEEINKLKKEKKTVDEKIKEAKKFPKKIEILEKREGQLREKIHFYLTRIPNILHESVHIGQDESENKELKRFGDVPKFKFKVKNHVEIVEQLGVVDFDASARVIGNGFYYLKGNLALLNQALIKFTVDFMQSKGYMYIEPPLMIRRKVAEAAGDLSAFELALYKIQGEDAYLIPTAEHAILGMLSGKTINEEDLPLKFFGYSMCFRKEIGSHGINEKGFWRTHQFNKVEQFIFCKPEDSWKYYEELRKNSEEIYQKLKIPYKILSMCSGDTGDWKAKTEDIEAYRSTTNSYEEVGSLTNCTDYQARRLNIKCVNNKGEKRVLHTLNNTALATSRAMVVIIENYQREDGSILIPDVLVSYMNGIKKISKNEPGGI